MCLRYVVLWYLQKNMSQIGWVSLHRSRQVSQLIPWHNRTKNFMKLNWNFSSPQRFLNEKKACPWPQYRNLATKILARQEAPPGSVGAALLHAHSDFPTLRHPWRFCHIFVTFSEYMNFNKLEIMRYMRMKKNRLQLQNCFYSIGHCLSL